MTDFYLICIHVHKLLNTCVCTCNEFKNISLVSDYEVYYTSTIVLDIIHKNTYILTAKKSIAKYNKSGIKYE